jgi:hypothetical protein
MSVDTGRDAIWRITNEMDARGMREQAEAVFALLARAEKAEAALAESERAYAVLAELRQGDVLRAAEAERGAAVQVARDAAGRYRGLKDTCAQCAVLMAENIALEIESRNLPLPGEAARDE